MPLRALCSPLIFFQIINRIALKIKQAQDQLLMTDASSINEYHSQMVRARALVSCDY